jgi:protein-tyrosine-phosphatase
VSSSRTRVTGKRDELAAWADVVVTMGCRDACPLLPGKRYVDWSLPDPHGRALTQVRAIRDEIHCRIDERCTELG